MSEWTGVKQIFLNALSQTTTTDLSFLNLHLVFSTRNSPQKEELPYK